MLPSDWGKPTRLALSRIPDRRVMQFWDKDHLVAKELDHQLAPGQLSYSKRDGIIWDVVACTLLQRNGVCRQFSLTVISWTPSRNLANDSNYSCASPSAGPTEH